MTVLALREVSIAFGGPPLLDGADFRIERGERVCLLGRNGAGKCTIMKLLDGTMLPDAGEVVRQGGVTVARLEQDVPNEISGSLFDVVAAGLGSVGALLARYHEASHLVANSVDDANEAALRELDR
ncbi:MAG: ATP-binding cassette domain-containing protein, partial [Gemmatimonadaceae bacterium]